MSWASNCFEVTSVDSPRTNLTKLQHLSLDDKILYSTVKIKEFYLAKKGMVYVSYSGGKDSTVLLHLVRSIYPDTPAVYVDTGLEFPEIRDMVKQTENVTWIRPKKNFKQVIEDYGYPCIGKVAAHWINLAQRGQPSGIRQMNTDTKFGFKRYNYMVDAPFKVSEKCCDVMKKRPAHQYHKETGRFPFIGTRAEESQIRQEAFMDHGDEEYTEATQSSTPLSIWTEKDTWDYIRRYDLPYSKAYDMGYDRTGCIFCMFGITQDRDRFLTLKATHPKQWAFCMREREWRSRYEGSPGIHGDSHRMQPDQPYPMVRIGGFRMSNQQIIIGNSLEVLKSFESDSIDLCVTSPPYWGLRDYGSEPVDYDGWCGQLGLEQSPTDYINHLCLIFDEVKRVLKPTGSCWVNIGDSYSSNVGCYTSDYITSSKHVHGKPKLPKTKIVRDKSLVQIPSRFAIAMTDRGWILRNECIWHKPNVMPVSVTDRFTVDFEKVFFFTKEPHYYFKQQLEPLAEGSLERSIRALNTKKINLDANNSNPVDLEKMGKRFVNPEGRNKRTVWTIPTSKSYEEHVAMFPMELIDAPIQSCCPGGGDHP